MEKEKKNSEQIEIRIRLKGKKKNGTKKWQKPTLEDVSEKIMAQPYIRFT